MHPETPAYLRGIVAPLFTPAFGDRSIDHDGMRRYLDFVVSKRCVDAVFFRSGVGKWKTWTRAEVEAVLETVSDHLRGRIPFLMGAMGVFRGPDTRTDGYTRESIELARLAAARGAAAAVLTTPFALEPDRRGRGVEQVMWDYFREVDAAVDGPLVLYKTPGEEVYDIAPPFLERLLGETKHLVGMKYSTPDAGKFARLCEVARRARPGFGMLSGHEGFYLDNLRAGACGIVSEGCTPYPELFKFLKEAHDRGREEVAREAQRSIAALLACHQNDYDASAKGIAILIGQGLHIDSETRDGAELPDPVVQAEIIAMINSAIDRCRRLMRQVEG
ncbi:MAG: dihydrodipicolinate synthase family protein [Planctomycetes bacterium]|nr:dihydrodipicolinate synthase family protein [Planctomycetota bacterium]